MPSFLKVGAENSHLSQYEPLQFQILQCVGETKELKNGGCTMSKGQMEGKVIS